LNLSIFTARFVLSMNCEHHNEKRRFDNELICTVCSPENAGKKSADAKQTPMKSTMAVFRPAKLFTDFLPLHPRCEKVSVSKNLKNARDG